MMAANAAARRRKRQKKKDRQKQLKKKAKLLKQLQGESEDAESAQPDDQAAQKIGPQVGEPMRDDSD
jgi:hypothetical protein